MTIAFPSHNRRHTRVRLRRSNHARKCPICQGQGCGQADGITLCWRVSSDKQAKSGAFIHTGNGQPVAVKQELVKPETLRASIERRHQIYSALLSILPLSGHHADHLAEVRNLSEETITNSQFASVPSREDGDWLAQQFAKQSELSGIPGFWKRYEFWVMRFSGTPGFFIPIRNLLGQVEALEIRRDGEASPKYLLFSSTDLPSGCSSGAPAHFARVTPTSPSLIITEGILKAYVISERLNVPVVGLVGAGTFPDSFGKTLRRQIPTLRRVLIAYDHPDREASDRARGNTRAQLERLSESLGSAGISSESLTWDPARGKGFDDYLLEVAN